jgi:PHS family inorganic phosphate transporter-like MFS transporter
MVLPAGGAIPAPSRQILESLDASKVQRYHFRTIVVAGMGFFTDAYDLFVISLVIPILAGVYGHGQFSATTTGLLGAAALLGAAVGQVLFGFLGDRLGRKKVYAITLTVMAISSIGSALSVPFATLTTVQVLMVWRFFLGVGVGGDYPLSATIMSEYSNVRSRGRLVASVFAMQGFGLLTGAVATLGAVFFLPSLDVVWRVVLGVGAVPALFTIYFRTRMPETPRFSLAAGHTREAAQAVEDLTGRKVDTSNAPMESSRVPFRRFLALYGLLLVGTASTWFFLDMAFYSTNVFNPEVLRLIGFGGTKGLPILDTVRTLALGNVLIALFASVPGYWVAVALIDRVGRRPLQYIGFGVMTIAFLFLAFAYGPLTAMIPVFLVVYGTTFFFANFGPNTTTFVYPSEVFPTSYRTTGHGISSAAGKIGAVIAVFFFTSIVAADGLPFMLGLLALFSFLGFVITLAILPETSQRSLEDVSGEDELAVMVRRFSTYLRSLTLTVNQGALALRELLKDPARDPGPKIAAIRAIEHAADEEVHRIYVELNTRGLSPEVRAEIGKLASALDDIMDGIEGVSARVETYQLTTPTADLSRFADIVVRSADQVAQGILGLDELYRGSTGRLNAAIIEVNRLENEADDLLRELLAALFRRTDPVEILKWKDFYERLEVITDRCEDVTDIFQDLQVRYAPPA